MNTDSFFSIPREELLDYYPEILKNSEELFESAIILAQNQKYGTAISHLLTSAEETVKALIVVLDGKGFELRSVKGMDVFFKNHEIRFLICFLVSAISLFKEDVLDVVKIAKEDPSKVIYYLTPFEKDGRLKKKLVWYLLKKLVSIRKEHKWFSKAVLFRQNGFYVDMKGKLLSPIQITKKDFIATKVRIEKVNNMVKFAIDCYLSNDPSALVEIENAKQMFLQEDLYSKMELHLEKIKKTRASFFSDIA